MQNSADAELRHTFNDLGNDLCLGGCGVLRLGNDLCLGGYGVLRVLLVLVWQREQGEKDGASSVISRR